MVTIQITKQLKIISFGKSVLQFLVYSLSILYLITFCITFTTILHEYSHFMGTKLVNVQSNLYFSDKTKQRIESLTFGILSGSSLEHDTYKDLDSQMNESANGMVAIEKEKLSDREYFVIALLGPLGTIISLIFFLLIVDKFFVKHIMTKTYRIIYLVLVIGYFTLSLVSNLNFLDKSTDGGQMYTIIKNNI